MSYYDINKDTMIAYQLNYYRENRDKYLEYMRVYNRMHYLKRKSEKVPKPKKEKKPKPKKEKVPKPKKEKEKVSTPIAIVEIPVLPTRIYRGNFILSFD
jgi:hypothetical protein